MNEIPVSEEWRDVVGHEGRYMVSNYGRVKSIDMSLQSRSKKGGSFMRKGQLLKGVECNGYRIVELRGKRRTVHRLVLESFVGRCPDGCVACHWDGVRSNNYVGNLRWASQKENLRDRERHGTENKGTRNGRAKLTEQQVMEIFYSRERLVDLSQKYGVGLTILSEIRRGTKWKHITKNDQRELACG